MSLPVRQAYAKAQALRFYPQLNRKTVFCRAKKNRRESGKLTRAPITPRTTILSHSTQMEMAITRYLNQTMLSCPRSSETSTTWTSLTTLTTSSFWSKIHLQDSL